MDAQYFIDKFEAIPEEQWGMHLYSQIDPATGIVRRCALGHCGQKPEKPWTKEAYALRELFSSKNLFIVGVNDNKSEQYPQETPKQRILAALRKNYEAR